MPECVDLEIEFARDQGNVFHLFSRLDYPANAEVPEGIHGAVAFDFGKLEQLRSSKNFGDYGNVLSASLFDSNRNQLSRQLQRAIDLAANNLKIRLRLVIDDACPELHRLLWETMHHPFEQSVLSTSPNFYLSRVLRHGRPRSFTLRQKVDLRALVLIADPLPPSDSSWSESDVIDLKEEEARARAALDRFQSKFLITDRANPGAASLKNLLGELTANRYDLLLLVCHGTFSQLDADSVLRLEGDDGRVEWITGKSFITSFEKLPTPPTMVILCSCSTSGSGRRSDDLLAALGPRLVQAGVPAVIAMQGPLAMATAKIFFPRFFAELLREGIVDKAVASARIATEQQLCDDFYAPVLFHRLRSGRIWYGNDEPLTDTQSIEWTAHLQSLRSGKTTLVMGSALLDPYIGSQAEIATQLAHKYNYAFSDSERDDFAMVCQFIDYTMGRDNLDNALCSEYLSQLIQEYAGKIEELMAEAQIVAIRSHSQPNQELQRILKAVWSRYRDTDPITKLAQLPFKAYLSTNQDTLIEAAMPLEKQPRVWRCGLGDAISLSGETLNPSHLAVDLTPARPLIAYLQGTFDDPGGMILTEQNYYHQLSEAAAGTNEFVKCVNQVFTGSALIFLGFRLHEWDFRILYRRLQLINGWPANKRFFHVAVQIDPSSARGTGSETVVKKFLVQFFDNVRFQVFRGSVAQFTDELYRRYQQP